MHLQQYVPTFRNDIAGRVAAVRRDFPKRTFGTVKLAEIQTGRSQRGNPVSQIQTKRSLGLGLFFRFAFTEHRVV